jgi:hypothetical protein
MSPLMPLEQSKYSIFMVSRYLIGSEAVFRGTPDDVPGQLALQSRKLGAGTQGGFGPGLGAEDFFADNM